MAEGDRYAGLIARYRDRLPRADDACIISLCEGNTPLIRLHRLSAEFGERVEVPEDFAHPGCTRELGVSECVEVSE